MNTESRIDSNAKFTFKPPGPSKTLNKPPDNKNLYAKIAKGSLIRQKFYRSEFKNSTRDYFDSFKDRAIEAEEMFGNLFEGIQPLNYKKHPSLYAYKIVFRSAEEVAKLKFEDQLIELQRGIDNSNILQNIIVQNVPIYNENRAIIMQKLHDYFSKYGMFWTFSTKIVQ